MKKETMERVLSETGSLDLIQNMITARCALVFTKVKMRHLRKDHPKYISFSEDVSRRRNIDEVYINAHLAINLYEDMVCLDGAGGSDPEMAWCEFIESIKGIEL